MGIGERFEFEKTGRIDPEPNLPRRVKRRFKIEVNTRTFYDFECEVDEGTPQEQEEEAEAQFACLSFEECKPFTDHDADGTLWVSEATLIEDEKDGPKSAS